MEGILFASIGATLFRTYDDPCFPFDDGGEDVDVTLLPSVSNDSLSLWIHSSLSLVSSLFNVSGVNSESL